ncbi:holin family protein [Roseobacter weihaiensis]|uniref:holin family protein n=1 Tax=Roseobacter weihaiensis TaxID=2763262 RepID=UPI001D0B52D9|nr:holin family protein [Roseobacter sp. H9]
MGLITGLLNVIFGNDRNVFKETAEVFRANAEENAARGQELRIEALTQFGREYEAKNDSVFNRIMDGVNRLPRPAMALGTLGLFVAAMVDPIWFAARMQGVALVPEPLWWLLGVIVSFYFGARHQIKSQQFQRSIAQSVALVPKVADNLRMLQSLRATSPGVADSGPDARLRSVALQPEANPALEDWQRAVAHPATK